MKSKKIMMLVIVIFVIFVVSQIYLQVAGDDSNNNLGPPPTPTLFPAQVELVNEDGTYILYDSINFRIIYFGDSDRYEIAIYTPPFAQMREIAEQQLLRELNITDQEACNYNVVVRVSENVDPRNSTQNFPLSFCE